MKRHLWLGAGLAGLLALSLTACASSNRSSETTASGASGSAAESGGGQPANPDGQIVFGAAGAPSMFDPLYATDGETFRVARQINEGLIRFKPGTADPEPALATAWEQTPDGKTWTFTIRDGVKFHDGTPVDAAAVCYNLDRMYNQTGAGATQAQYWSDVMGGFAGQVDESGKPVPSVYNSCKADGNKAVITLNTATSKFPGVLGLPSYSIQSPTALKQYTPTMLSRKVIRSSTRPTRPTTRPVPVRTSSSRSTRPTTPSPWSATTTTTARRPRTRR